jgi:hypothetical protein
MRIQGKQIQGPNVETIIIPRGNADPIVFKAQAVLDYEDFEKLCPEPKPPVILKPGGVETRDFKDKAYVAAVMARNTNQSYYMFIKSLMATPGLEFEKVRLDSPDTWQHFEQELKEAGLSQVERNKITQGIMIANCLDESKIEEARNRFTQSQAISVSDAISQKGV